jgi:hypothetical protein
MDVVGHRAVSEDPDFMPAAVLPQPFQIDFAVFLREKHILPAVAALGDAVGESREHGACRSWHGGELTGIAQKRVASRMALT